MLQKLWQARLFQTSYGRQIIMTKKQSKKGRKKIRTKIERKGKKTKKERRELVRKSMHQ